MVETIGDPNLDLPTKLRRLASIAVADYPRSLFKLQIIDADAMLRVVPEFVTPALQHIVDRYRSILGPVDIRDARRSCRS